MESTHISPIRAHQFGNRPDIPQLRHAENSTNPPNDESHERSHADRKLRRVPPSSPVITTPKPKDEALLDGDRKPNSHPVAHQSQEIGKDLGEVAAAREGADGVDDDADGVPDDAGHLLGIAAKDLEVDARRIGRWDGVGDEAQGYDHRAELAEAVERPEAFDD